jgi:hypothetical protein
MGPQAVAFPVTGILVILLGFGVLRSGTCEVGHSLLGGLHF